MDAKGEKEVQKKNRQIEKQMCRSFNHTLERLVVLNRIFDPEFFYWFHIQNEQARSVGDDQGAFARRGKHLKEMGVKKGIWDYQFFYLHRASGILRTAWIEFKVPSVRGHANGGLSESQVDFRKWLEQTRQPHAIAYSAQEGLHFLGQLSIVKENIF